MLHAYTESGGTLSRMPDGADLAQAVWIDALRPTLAEAQAVAALGIDVPSLEDMEEIEISNRLYREGPLDYITVVLPGHSTANEPISGPVSFILSHDRLVTVRHHRARPFETYPNRADKTGPGCGSAHAIFLSLIEEITGRIADLLESVGRNLDQLGRTIHEPQHRQKSQDRLEVALRRLGREGHLIGILRLSLLTLDRAIGFYDQSDRKADKRLEPALKALRRDINALEVHTDFLSSRVAQATDLTLGMINLAQNATFRLLSVVTILFSPPLLIAAIYGMNFRVMPELQWAFGYPAALIAMVVSPIVVWLCIRWKNWL